MQEPSTHRRDRPAETTTEVLPGRLVLVVGPSGAGKDTLIAAARERLGDDPRYAVPRRVVTRPASAAEDNIAAGASEFAAIADLGGFALAWEAHGHRYGIPARIVSDLAEGRTVVVNVSRTVVREARDRWPDVTVVEVSAPAEVLASRIAARARGSDAASGDRLARRFETEDLPQPDVAVDNGGDLRAAVDAFLRTIALA